MKYQKRKYICEKLNTPYVPQRMRLHNLLDIENIYYECNKNKYNKVMKIVFYDTKQNKKDFYSIYNDKDFIKDIKIIDDEYFVILFRRYVKKLDIFVAKIMNEEVLNKAKSVVADFII